MFSKSGGGLIASYNLYERIIWLHEQIRSGLYPNAQDMAYEFELHKRTCQRVISYFRDRLQAPLAYSKKNQGYFYTNPDYCLPLAKISQEEILALILAKHIFDIDLNTFFSVHIILQSLTLFNKKFIKNCQSC